MFTQISLSELYCLYNERLIKMHSHLKKISLIRIEIRCNTLNACDIIFYLKLKYYKTILKVNIYIYIYIT